MADTMRLGVEYFIILCSLETVLKNQILSCFHLIYRMLGIIDSGITEKSLSKNSISEWRTFGMADTMRLGVGYFIILCSLESFKNLQQ